MSNKTAFEQLGYGKFDPKPEYKTHALVKTKDGWVVLEILMKGLQAVEVAVVCQPTIWAHAAERFKVFTVKNMGAMNA